MFRKIVVITPILNRPFFMPIIDEIMFRQTFSDFRHIIIEERESYNKHKYKFTNRNSEYLLVDEDRISISNKMNLALDRCKENDVIIRMDSDDFFNRNYIKTIVNIFNKQAPPVVCCSSTIHYNLLTGRYMVSSLRFTGNVAFVKKDYTQYSSEFGANIIGEDVEFIKRLSENGAYYFPGMDEALYRTLRRGKGHTVANFSSVQSVFIKHTVDLQDFGRVNENNERIDEYGKATLFSIDNGENLCAFTPSQHVDEKMNMLKLIVGDKIFNMYKDIIKMRKDSLKSIAKKEEDSIPILTSIDPPKSKIDVPKISPKQTIEITKNDIQKNYIAVSFYTPEYERIVKFLKTSMDWLGIPYHIEKHPKTEDWQKTTWKKPEFIKKMMETYPNKDIFWIDADAVFVRYPTDLEQPKEDFTICYRDNPNKNKRFYHAGCILIKQSAKPLIEEWIKLKTKYEAIVPEQYVINSALDKCPKISLGCLSTDYLNTLHTNAKRTDGLIMTHDPIVIHFIFSNTTDEKSDTYKQEPLTIYNLYTTNGEANAINILRYKAQMERNARKRR